MESDLRDLLCETETFMDETPLMELAFSEMDPNFDIENVLVADSEDSWLSESPLIHTAESSLMEGIETMEVALRLSEDMQRFFLEILGIWCPLVLSCPNILYGPPANSI